MGEAWTERNRVTYKIVCQMHSMRYQSIARLDSFTLVLYNKFNGTTAIPGGAGGTHLSRVKCFLSISQT